MDRAYTMFGIDESYIKKINEVIEKCEDRLKAFDYHYSKHNSFQNEARNYLHYNIELDRIGDFLIYACTNVVVDTLDGNFKGLSVENDDSGNIFINGKEVVSGCTAEDFEKKFTIKLNDSDAKAFCRDSFSYKELFFILDAASLHHISYDKYRTCAFRDFACDVDCSQNSEDLYDAFDYFMHKVDEAERGKVFYDNSGYGEVSTLLTHNSSDNTL